MPRSEFGPILPRVMPCLLVQEGRLVKTVRFRNPAYVGDPVNAVKIYNEKEVDEVVLLDISATRSGREPDFALVETIVSECFMPVCYGGGVASSDHIRKLIGLGIEKIAINTRAAEDPSLITEGARICGSQSIVASIDFATNWLGRAQVRTHGGKHSTGRHPVEYAREMEARGAGEILLTSIDRDGTWGGYDVSMLRAVSDAVQVPVIACGGAGSVSDLGKGIREGGASACAAGSMFVYQGKGLGVLIRFPSREELFRVLGVPA